ncbi:MAG: NAD-dependent epimerase/dehydratase family protein [Candidatus Nitrosopumilus sp. bin_6a]
MKVLLTGNTGFVGSNIGNFLLKKGYVVEGISRKTISRDYLTHSFDLKKSNFIERFQPKTKFDAIIHCAAITDELDISTIFENNILSTLNILNFCKLQKIKKFVLISGHNVYSQHSHTPIHEKSKIAPSSNYGLTKLIQENLTQFFAKNFLINVVILRLSYTYGANQDSKKMIPTLINKYVNSEPIKLDRYVNGFQKIDLINIQDVCKVIPNTLKLKKQFDIFNIASGKTVTVKDIIKILKQNMKSKSLISINDINKKINHFQYNIDHAKKILNFKPSTDLEKGINSLIPDFT